MIVFHPIFSFSITVIASGRFPTIIHEPFPIKKKTGCDAILPGYESDAKAVFQGECNKKGLIFGLGTDKDVLAVTEIIDVNMVYAARVNASGHFVNLILI